MSTKYIIVAYSKSGGKWKRLYYGKPYEYIDENTAQATAFANRQLTVNIDGDFLTYLVRAEDAPKVGLLEINWRARE